jgi:hypothetical protein
MFHCVYLLHLCLLTFC